MVEKDLLEFDLTDLDELDIEDIPEEEKTYEICLIGLDNKFNPLGFEICLDSGYTDEIEARKCYEFCAIEENLQEVFKQNQVELPPEIAHLYIRLESKFADYVELEDENELKLKKLIG